MEVRVGLSARWVVSLAPYDGSVDEEAMNVELLAVLTQILLTSTLLPTEPFMTLVEESFKGGLTHTGSRPAIRRDRRSPRGGELNRRRRSWF
jgi:hypothetical protein